MSKDLSEKFKKAYNKINKSKNICIVSHVNPDGDNIGSLLALGIALKQNVSKNIVIAKTDNIPEQFNFMPNIELIEDIKPESKYDLLIVLDCGDIGRLGKLKDIVHNSKTIINIDHHITNEMFGDINIVDEKSSSTGEIVFKFLEQMNYQLTTDIATCLYVAISTDTGSFKYDSTTYETHIIASKLLKTGIDLNEIIVNLYQSKSLRKTKLMIEALTSLELYFNNNLGIVEVTQDMLSQFDASIEDADGIVDFIRDINDVEVSCVLKEVNSNEVKITLRSKKYVDVSQVAKAFNGGGHKKAAGCTINENIETAKAMIVKKIADILG